MFLFLSSEKKATEKSLKDMPSLAREWKTSWGKKRKKGGRPRGGGKNAPDSRESRVK